MSNRVKTWVEMDRKRSERGSIEPHSVDTIKKAQIMGETGSNQEWNGVDRKQQSRIVGQTETKNCSTHVSKRVDSVKYSRIMGRTETKRGWNHESSRIDSVKQDRIMGRTER